MVWFLWTAWGLGGNVTILGKVRYPPPPAPHQKNKRNVGLAEIQRPYSLHQKLNEKIFFKKRKRSKVSYLYVPRESKASCIWTLTFWTPGSLIITAMMVYCDSNCTNHLEWSSALSCKCLGFNLKAWRRNREKGGGAARVGNYEYSNPSQWMRLRRFHCASLSFFFKSKKALCCKAEFCSIVMAWHRKNYHAIWLKMLSVISVASII